VPARPFSRRTALGTFGILTTVGLTGCSARATIDSLKAPTPPTPSAPTNPDVGLVAQVGRAMTTADSAAPAAFARLHHAQLSRLGETSVASPGTSGGNWRSAQKRLVTTLTEASVAATETDLVRLLASATAGQRQLLRARGLG